MPQRFLSVKNFEKYQHFKQANPPWIKLYKSLFHDREFMRLPISCKYVYIGLIILASEGCNKVFNDQSWIAQRLAILPSEIDLKPLYRSGFLIASASTARRYKLSLREETETEKSRGEGLTPPATCGQVRKSETELPEGFHANEKHQAIAQGLGLNVHAEVIKFKDRALAKGTKYKDWNAGFRTWLNNAYDFQQRRVT